MITIKRPEEIARMRRAGAILSEILVAFEGALRPGITTAELDRLADGMMRRAGAVPSFKGYYGFPGSICASVNDEVVHGIPSSTRRIREGDVVSLDIGCIWEGWHADCARTYPVGQVANPAALDLIDATRRAMESGIAAAVAGNRLGDVGAAIEAVAAQGGYGLVRPFVGHGIGTAMHEEPNVPNYGRPGTGLRLEAGMCLAIEPMFNLGGDEVYVEDDGWTVRTADGSLSAHFENTIAIGESRPEVLTQ
ncbi:MAG: type I methionyl aminopeptidase [Chloroflexota bacterium]|nr:type I methionyl aminopeptidase [Chloroflexota bacterium]